MSRRTAARAALVVLGLATAVWGALSVAGSLSHADRVVAERVAGVRAVEVDAGMGDVVVTADPAAEDISLRQTQRWWLGTPRFSARRAGDVLEIRSSCPATPGLPCSGTLELVVPPGTAIDVRTDDAPVRLDGLAGTVVVRVDGHGELSEGYIAMLPPQLRGAMATMPGLPTRGAFMDVDLDLDTGRIVGLF